MNYYNTVVRLSEYGKIKIRFNEIMDRRGITRNRLANLTGVRFEVIDRFYKGKVERLDLDILARVCFVLNCKVSDVLEFVKE